MARTFWWRQVIIRYLIVTAKEKNIEQERGYALGRGRGPDMLQGQGRLSVKS